jgi:hypothetical protein
MRGFFSLSTPSDLFRKLESDFERVLENPKDVYAAFDFCVTAWHLVDWMFPDTKSPERATMLKRHPILRACEHLAVGAKHFEPNSDRHNSVSSMADTSVWGHGVWEKGVWGANVWSGELSVRLDGDAKEALGASLLFQDFSVKVMATWRGELSRE